jgi:ABC-type branched-subunit amino acid transport system permease subunit
MITLAFAQLVYYLSSGLEAMAETTASYQPQPLLADRSARQDLVLLALLRALPTLWFCGRMAHSRFGYAARRAPTSCA